MDEDRRSELSGSVRADRRVLWTQVLVGFAAAIGLILLGVGRGLSPSVIGPLVVLVFVGIGMGWRNRRTDTLSDPATETTISSQAGGSIRLTDFAFSEKAPTWRGWRRDVGDVTVEPEKISISGLRRQLVVRSPFHAELFRSRYFYWTMVGVTGMAASGEAMTVYLVGMRGPKSKFAARPQDVENRGRELITRVNHRPPGPGH